MTESHVLDALAARHTTEAFFARVKLGPTWGAGTLHVMDAVSVKPSWARPRITGYEIKVTRQDFQRDDKWPAYFDACHRFYWACPAGLIKRTEVDDRAGLVWVSASGKAHVRKAAIHRKIEIPAGLLYYLVISRCEELDPPMTNERACREWLEDKRTTRELGYEVSTRLVKQLAETESRFKSYRKYGGEIQELLTEHGIKGAWALRALLRAKRVGVDVGQLRFLQRSLEQQAERIAKIVTDAEASQVPTGRNGGKG